MSETETTLDELWGRATAAETMAAILNGVRAARAGGDDAEGHVGRVLEALVRLHHRLAEGPLPAEQLAVFRTELADGLNSFARLIFYFVVSLQSDAASANEGNEWIDLCTRRSAIQFVLDEFAGTEAVSMIYPEDLAELDADLRDVGQRQGPMPSSWLLHNLPVSHWWWRYGPVSSSK